MDKKTQKQLKREAKEKKRQEKLEKQKAKNEQLDREISMMKKEIEKNKKSKNSGSNGNNSNKDNGKKPNKKTVIIGLVTLFLILFFFGSQLVSTATMMSTDEISTSEFLSAVDQERVKNVIYDSGSYTVSGTYIPDKTNGSVVLDAYNGAVSAINDATGTEIEKINTKQIEGVSGPERQYKATFIGQDSLLELMQKHPGIQYEIVLPSAWSDIIMTLLPIALIGLLLFFFFSQMTKMNNQQMGFGKTKSRKSEEERPTVKFDDVAGVDEAVEEIAEVKDFLSNPKKYLDMGAKIPKGCLLVGPPGTGKTLLARAVAGEAGVPFFNISGSDFVEMFVGVGASRVRDLFKQAKECSPSIIFIDEIDAVGRHRGAGLGGGHDEREQTLNQILVEMDGFDKSDSVVLIAATNRVDILDPALLRPGRFDRQIVVDVPDVKGREKILKVHAKGKPFDKSVNFNRVAQLTPGFTGADLANLMNESALLAARKNKKHISQLEVSESMERVIAGPERKSRIIDDETKKTISYHESGHALIGHLLPKADPVHKISIISRGRALGYTLSIPKEDKVLNSYREMIDELCVFMGGRVAEEIFCEDITTGASNDLERATKIARSIVTQYGMSPKLGTQVFGEPNHEVFLGKDYGNTKDYSEKTAERIDEEVSVIMKTAHDRAVTILSDNKAQMDLMASVLLERETVEGEACDMLLDNKWEEYLEKEKALLAEDNSSQDSESDDSKNESSEPDKEVKDKNQDSQPFAKVEENVQDNKPKIIESKLNNNTDSQALKKNKIINDEVISREPKVADEQPKSKPIVVESRPERKAENVSDSGKISALESLNKLLDQDVDNEYNVPIAPYISGKIKKIEEKPEQAPESEQNNDTFAPEKKEESSFKPEQPKTHDKPFLSGKIKAKGLKITSSKKKKSKKDNGRDAWGQKKNDSGVVLDDTTIPRVFKNEAKNVYVTKTIKISKDNNDNKEEDGGQKN